jgi:preprotein translocase subunit SecG
LALPDFFCVPLEFEDAGVLVGGFASGERGDPTGAGAGNVLTKLTKWNAVIFLFLCLFLSLDFMRPKELSEMLGQNAPTVKSNAPAPPPVGSPLSPEANPPTNTPASSNSNGTQKKSGKANPEKKKTD